MLEHDRVAVETSASRLSDLRVRRQDTRVVAAELRLLAAELRRESREMSSLLEGWRESSAITEWTQDDCLECGNPVLASMESGGVEYAKCPVCRTSLMRPADGEGEWRRPRGKGSHRDL
jgi:hypothetical protein